MENEQHHYELRSRSRSRSHTPMVPNRLLPDSEITEHHYELRKRSRERSHTPGEVTSSRRSGSRSLTGSSSKMHEKNMESIEESKEGSVIESVTDNQSTKSESSIVTSKKAERRSERQRAKRQIFVNGQSESKENISNQKVERKRKSLTPRRILTSDYSSEEGEREDPPSRPGSAYEIYKQSGDWWNAYPKTDYTYSLSSQCRYEIAPGVLAMPNMSRRPIRTDDGGNNVPQTSSQTSRRTTESGFSDTVDTVDLKETGSVLRSSEDISHMHTTADFTRRSSVYKKTHVEQYMSHKEVVYTDSGSPSFRQRYSSWFSSTPSKYTDIYNTSQYDSDVEFDKIMTSSVVQTNQRWKIVQWFTYFTTFIAVWFRKTVEFFKFRTDRRNHYYDAQTYRYFHESKWSTLRKTMERYSRNIYFFIARLFLFDAWLLSQFTGVRRWLQEKTPKILWIALIPLLLLGCWCITGYLSVSPAIENVPETTTEKILPSIKWKNRESREIEEKFTNNDALIDRIATLEKEQIYQMEHLVNVTQVLEDYKRSDADFQEKYNDKIADLASKLDISELNNVLNNELKVIKYEFEKLRDLYAELKSCCNANKEAVMNENIEKHVEKILSGYFPSGTSKEDLTKHIHKILASRDGEDQTVLSNSADSPSAYISEERVREIVKEILRIYDADKTGQVDYALESAGGQIISTRCTQRYDIKSRAYGLFGFTLYYESTNPRTVIQGNALQPGTCWAFQDFPGYLLIQLRCVIYVTGFTMEHVSSLILPNENMSSAPKKFDVWGLTNDNDPEPVKFGEYEFRNSGDNLQYFPVQNTEIKRPYEYIELRIHSNHGQLDYTCLYRFRVHGRQA